MERDALGTLQEPLKERYRAEPETALVTLRAQGSREAPVGFRAIRLRFELASDAGEEQIATLLRLTERYCVVLQTLSCPAELATSHVVSR